MKKYALPAFSLLLFLLSIVAIRGEWESQSDTFLQGVSFMEGLKVVHRKDGAKDWILTARRADFNEDGTRAMLSGVEASLSQQGLSFYADSGLYTIADGKMEVLGDVVARSSDYSVISEGIRFDSVSEKLTTDGPVRMEGKKFSVQGKGMDLDNTEQKVRINRDVKAIFHN